MSDSHNPISIGLETIDDGMRELSEHELAEARFNFLTDFVVGGDQSFGCFYREYEATSLPSSCRLVVGRRFNEFVRLFRVKLNNHRRRRSRARWNTTLAGIGEAVPAASSA